MHESAFIRWNVRDLPAKGRLPFEFKNVVFVVWKRTALQTEVYVFGYRLMNNFLKRK